MKKITIINKIILALSGGIDSSVSIWILKKLGFYIECVFIKCWDEKKNNKCSFYKDLKDSIKVCKIFKTKLHKIDFTYEYWNKVFKKFIKELKNNKTPNPDILCNKIIKFNLFLKFSIKILKGNYIATGHYIIKKKHHNNKYIILKAKDKSKDQSYFLHKITQKQLKKCIFPLGSYIKKDIRKIAKNLKLPNYKKKDSTGICFIGKKKFHYFIKNYIKIKKGNIINYKNKKKIGEHLGLFLYTIGQRKNLNIGGGFKNPLYVIKKNKKKNTLIVGEKNNHNLFKKSFYIKKIHIINNIHKNINKCSVKIRHLQKETKCFITKKKKKFKITLKNKTFAITKGQYAVFYLKNICIGGGKII